MELEFSRQIFGTTQISNLIKIRPAGAEWFPTDGHDETNIHFSRFCERARKPDHLNLPRPYLALHKLQILLPP